MKSLKKFLNFIKKKTFIIPMICCLTLSTIFGMGVSYAKYVEQYTNNGSANVAEFYGWEVTYSSSTISLDESTPSGVYAYVANFKISFDAKEVKRKYTLKIKAVKELTNPQSFSESQALTTVNYFLSSEQTINTTTQNNNNEIVINSRNAIAELTSNQISSIPLNNICISDVEQDSYENLGSNFSWANFSYEGMFDEEEKSLTLLKNHVVDAQEEDFHSISVIFYIDITYGVFPENFVFIYSLNVQQEM